MSTYIVWKENIRITHTVETLRKYNEKQWQTEKATKQSHIPLKNINCNIETQYLYHNHNTYRIGTQVS